MTLHVLCLGLPTCAEKGVNNRWKHTTSAGSHHGARYLWCCQCHRASIRSIDQVHHTPEWKVQHNNITMVDTSSLLWTASALKQLRALQICMSKRLTCIHFFHDFSHKSISIRQSCESRQNCMTWEFSSVFGKFLPLTWDQIHSTPGQKNVMIGISRYCISLLCQITSPNARCIEYARTIKNTYLQLGLLWLTCIFINCIYFEHFLRIQYKIGQYLPCPIKQCGNEVLPVLKNPRILFDSFGTESPVQISYIASNPLQIGRIGAAFDLPLWLLYKRCLCTHLVKLTNPHELCYPKKNQVPSGSTQPYFSRNFRSFPPSRFRRYFHRRNCFRVLMAFIGWVSPFPGAWISTTSANGWSW